MMFDAYLVDLLARKDVLTDGQTDRRTFAFLELLLQLKTGFYLDICYSGKLIKISRKQLYTTFIEMDICCSN